MSIFVAGSGSYPIVAQEKIDPTSIPGLNISVETFSPKCLTTIDNTYQIRVEAPAIETGVRILGSRMTSTTGQVEITFENFTTSTVDPANQNFNFLVF